MKETILFASSCTLFLSQESENSFFTILIVVFTILIVDQTVESSKKSPPEKHRQNL